MIAAAWRLSWGVMALAALAVAVSGAGCAGARPVVTPAPEYAALLEAERLSFALAESARLLDGISRTHIALEAEGRIGAVEDLQLSMALVYVAERIKATVGDLNNPGKAPAVRLAEFDQAVATLIRWLSDRVSTLPDAAARAEIKADAGPLEALLTGLRLEVMR